MFVCTLFHIFSLNESELFRYETVDLLITDPAKLLINLLDETEKNKNDKKKFTVKNFVVIGYIFLSF